MIIRSAQLKSMDRLMEEKFEVRLTAAMRCWYPRVFSPLNEMEARALVRERIADSGAYGLTWESSIARFVHLTFFCGRRAARHPRIRPFLEDPTVHRDVAMNSLYEDLTADDLKRIRGAGPWDRFVDPGYPPAAGHTGRRDELLRSSASAGSM